MSSGLAALLCLAAACTPKSGASDEPDPEGEVDAAPSERKDAAGLPKGPQADAREPTSMRDVAESPSQMDGASSAAETGAVDTSAPSDAGAQTGSFDRKVLGDGVVVWLEAGSGTQVTAGKLSRWADQSGKGNHALGEGSRMPTLKTDAKGRPVVGFAGKANPKDAGGSGGQYLRIKDSDSLHFGKGDWSVTFVAGYSNPIDATHNGAFGTFWSKWGNSMEVIFTGNWPYSENPNVEKSWVMATFGERGQPGLHTVAENLNDGKVRVYGLRKKGDMMELRVNGKSDGKGRGHYKDIDYTVGGSDVCIGGLFLNPASPDRALKGDVHLVVAVKGDLSDDALAALEAWAVARYAAP